jgi:glycerol-3-phosphate dehydrogenase (NAD(P)+)
VNPAGERVAVLGAGLMGAALAIAFDRAGSRVWLCGTEFDLALLDAIEATGTHPGLGVAVPDSLVLARPDEWPQFVAGAGVVAVAVVSAGVRAVVRQAAPLVGSGAVWAMGSKGWDPETAEPLSQVVQQESSNPVVIVVGPSLASELAAGTPTALVCASHVPEAAERVARSVSSETVRAFVTDDVPGVEVGAALKNVLAIAIGMCDGISEVKGRPMTNTKAALFSRGLIEMARMAVALGGRQETVLGLAGAGDLFVTVLGGRNGRFGRLVGTGLEPRQAIDQMGTTVEGFDNASEAVALADRLGLELPVARMVHSVLHKGADPEEAIGRLTLGAVEPEL